MRSKIRANSWIEIQGCNAGADRDYLVGIQTFFSGTARPKVSAPDWFQVFGHFGWTSIPDAEKNAQEQWDKPGVRAALAYWAPLITGTRLPKTPTFQDLLRYLRTHHVLPPAPTGTTATSRVIFLQGKGPGPNPQAFVRWLSQHQYLISKWADIQKQLLTQQDFGSNVHEVVVDWLQERYPGASKVIFRPSGEYDKHIIKV